ncbi:MAG TPA: hypothetical protein VI072_02510 [Polyangiaceae bacterium]
MTRPGRTFVVCSMLVACTPAVAPSPAHEPVQPESAPSELPSIPDDAERTRSPAADGSSVLAPVTQVSDADTPEARLARYRALWKSPRHEPAALAGPPRTSRLAPGAYLCKVSREYRLRDCTVERDAEGRTLLDFSPGNLLGMRGVVSDAKQGLEFEGWLTDNEPFGCTSCQERCIAQPDTCACDPLPPEAVVECLKQPLRMTLRPSGAGRYRATLRYKVYFNEYVGDGPNRRPEGYEAKEEKLEVELVRKANEDAAPKARQ